MNSDAYMYDRCTCDTSNYINTVKTYPADRCSDGKDTYNYPFCVTSNRATCIDNCKTESSKTADPITSSIIFAACTVACPLS